MCGRCGEGRPTLPVISRVRVSLQPRNAVRRQSAQTGTLTEPCKGKRASDQEPTPSKQQSVPLGYFLELWPSASSPENESSSRRTLVGYWCQGEPLIPTLCESAGGKAERHADALTCSAWGTRKSPCGQTRARDSSELQGQCLAFWLLRD